MTTRPNIRESDLRDERDRAHVVLEWAEEVVPGCPGRLVAIDRLRELISNLDAMRPQLDGLIAEADGANMEAALAALGIDHLEWSNLCDLGARLIDACEAVAAQATRAAGLHEEVRGLREDTLALEQRCDTLAAMVRRAARELTEPVHRANLLADLAAVLAEDEPPSPPEQPVTASAVPDEADVICAREGCGHAAGAHTGVGRGSCRGSVAGVRRCPCPRFVDPCEAT